MAIHQLERRQIIHASMAEAWDFFSSPKNLSRITPPSLGFEVLTNVPARMYPGLMIQYRVRPLLGFPVTWVTEITQVQEPRFFVDEQRVGPYRMWHHEHHFEDLGDGRVRMTDRVTYALRMRWLMGPVHAWVVRPELEKIFAFREKVVEELFPTPGARVTASV
jgi:ligand-binding SRPBCC domain-containing protein